MKVMQICSYAYEHAIPYRISQVIRAEILMYIREKTFREMKKDVGMTTAQKSKETRMEMGSIFVLYIQPTIPTYTSGSFRL